MRFWLFCLVLLCVPCIAAERSVSESVELHLDSPLYEAVVDADRHMLREMKFTVRSTDILRPVPDGIERRWWTTDRVREHALEDEDYRFSGFHRGHVRSLLLSAGSPHWRDVNLIGVIVPQYPRVNSPVISGLENHVASLAVEHETVDVLFQCMYDETSAVRLPSADEEHVVPSAFDYRLTYCVSDRACVSEVYVIPNIREPPSLDFRAYRR